MRIIAIADGDSLVGHMGDFSADLLISLGDVWDTTIERAQSMYACSKAFAVRGNHDSVAPFADSVTDLHARATEYEGVTFGGFEGSWKYKPRGHHLFEQYEVSKALQDFPYVDIFVAHNSPRGVHERDSEVHQGFDAFLDYVERKQPRYFLHGHQHLNEVSDLGRTKIFGVFGEGAFDLQTGANKPEEVTLTRC